ncbi:MAG: TIGR00266 family protein [Methanobacteriota archaeon]|nr:MAG: TIGR00266 family protein [Euryarchaeota archaeon]
MYNYQIVGGETFAELHVQLNPGEAIRAETGVMSYMDGTVQIETSSGGILTGIKRKFSGESFFLNTFTGPGKIVFAPPFPGSIQAFEITPDSAMILQQGSYLAGSLNVKISSKWGGFRSIFAGEGAFLTHASVEEGKGIFFTGASGIVVRHEIPPGQEFVVDTGIFFATTENAQFKLSRVGKGKSFLFGGEGLVLRFFGPCVVYTQSRVPFHFLFRSGSGGSALDLIT